MLALALAVALAQCPDARATRAAGAVLAVFAGTPAVVAVLSPEARPRALELYREPLYLLYIASAAVALGRNLYQRRACEAAKPWIPDLRGKHAEAEKQPHP